MAPAITMSTALLARLLAGAAAAPVHEVCGLLFGVDGEITDAAAYPNVAADPARTFEIDPAALLAAHRRARAGGPAIIGCFHSHPSGDARPSARDAADATADGAVWLILAQGRALAWRAVTHGAVHGRFDPLTLALRP